MLKKKEYFLIRKNETDFQSPLQLDGSLNSIMRIKMSIPESLTACHKWKLSSSLLKACNKQLKPIMICIRAKINRLIKNLMDKLSRK